MCLYLTCCSTWAVQVNLCTDTKYLRAVLVMTFVVLNSTYLYCSWVSSCRIRKLILSICLYNGSHVSLHISWLQGCLLRWEYNQGKWFVSILWIIFDFPMFVINFGLTSSLIYNTYFFLILFLQNKHILFINLICIIIAWSYTNSTFASKISEVFETEFNSE